MPLKILRDYRAVEEQHVKKIQEWLDADPERMKNQSSLDQGQSVEDYVGEYSDKFGIAAAMAGDIGYPEADKLWEEYEPFRDLEGDVLE